MRLLLDTHILIWTANTPAKLPRIAAALIADPANDLMFSPASITEVAIKWAQGRSDFPIDPRDLRHLLIGNGFGELPFTSDHACRVADLPLIHKDPFDRMLVAQALAEGMTLLTADAVLGGYGAMVRVVN